MDDFYDDFDEGEYMEGDNFEDQFDDNLEQEDCFEDDPENGAEPEEVESHEDSFSASEAFMFGIAMGWAYEEGLEEAERRKLEKQMQDDKDSKEESNI